jgi:hypothetical protein
MKVGDLFIDDGEIVENFVRASGPGGQNADEIAPFRDTVYVVSMGWNEYPRLQYGEKILFSWARLPNERA